MGHCNSNRAANGSDIKVHRFRVGEVESNDGKTRWLLRLFPNEVFMSYERICMSALKRHATRRNRSRNSRMNSHYHLLNEPFLGTLPFRGEGSLCVHRIYERERNP